MEFLLTLRRRGISDAAVLRAMDEVPRARFVESDMLGDACADQALPISCGQTISQPYVVAYMSEQLRVQPRDRVLEIGTGSGYQAAVLSRLAREVVSVERYRTLGDRARERLYALNYNNVEVIVGDGLVAAAERGPFDRIMVTAAAEAIPQPLVDQLTSSGVMILPVGPQKGPQHIVRLTKNASGIVNHEVLIAVRFVPLLPGKAHEL